MGATCSIPIRPAARGSPTKESAGRSRRPTSCRRPPSAKQKRPGDGPPVEALILAGGKAERLGAAAEGRPKPLVRVGGRPLAVYQVAGLASAGVTRVVV